MAALASRVSIEQTKGVLAARAGINVEQAFSIMRTHARGSGQTLTSVAASVIDDSLRADELTSS